MDTPEERLDYIKRDKGLTFSNLAVIIGDISSNAVRIGLKRNSLKRIYLNKIANNLNINKSWLFEGQGEIYLNEDHVNDIMAKYEPQPTSISLLDLRDDLKADLLELKKSTAKKQHIQGLTNSIAENFEDVTRALLKMLEHNEKVEEFMDQIDLESLKKATKQLNQSK